MHVCIDDSEVHHVWILLTKHHDLPTLFRHAERTAQTDSTDSCSMASSWSPQLRCLQLDEIHVEARVGWILALLSPYKPVPFPWYISRGRAYTINASFITRLFYDCSAVSPRVNHVEVSAYAQVRPCVSMRGIHFDNSTALIFSVKFLTSFANIQARVDLARLLSSE